AKGARLAAGATAIEVLAHDCDRIVGELAGVGTGLPGLWVTAARTPIVAATGEGLELIVGVESPAAELGPDTPALQHDGRAYRIWRRVKNFSNPGADRLVYVADPMTGTIIFAPAARVPGADGTLSDAADGLAAAPPSGRQIRLWYASGGGSAGNVAAGTLMVLKDPVAGVQVTNLAPATGGRDAETVDNALIRGPRELHSLERAVTARDFELLALQSTGGVARSKAFTRSTLWAHASPGAVEVVLVPDVPAPARFGGRVSAATMAQYETEEVRTRIGDALDERRPLGTACLVTWARYKTVSARARVVAHPQEDHAALSRRVLDRLYRTISPLPSAEAGGWRFGQALRTSHIYDVALSEPGVSYVDRVELTADDITETEIRCLASDNFQAQTWYAGSGSTLFRSVDDGDGWEVVAQFSGEMVDVVAAHPSRPGLVAVATRLIESGGSRVQLSLDCGETWSRRAETAFTIQDVAWGMRRDAAILWLATDAGLFELAGGPDASPVQVLVHASDQARGFYAVTVWGGTHDTGTVAVAAQRTGGVFVSAAGGRGSSFREIGLVGQDVRVLAIQQEGPRAYLWAGMAAPGAGDPGSGCSSWELLASGDDPADRWIAFSAGWNGGSCRALAFSGPAIVAASHHGGVLRLPARKSGAAWVQPSLDSGLPLRELPNVFHPVDALASNRSGELILAGGSQGIFRSRLPGAVYQSCSRKVLLDKITLPPTWLFCSGEHDVRVVSEDEADRD
ncbi:MAG: putative baseplate assembly protein, partial [Acidobacteriota bacterium]